MTLKDCIQINMNNLHEKRCLKDFQAITFEGLISHFDTYTKLLAETYWSNAFLLLDFD